MALRTGPGGGVTVGRPTVNTLAYAYSVFLYLQGVPFGTVLKAREVIEPAPAFDAATNGTDEEFAEMERSIERMRLLDGQEKFVQENRRFHQVVARAGRNKVLESFWEAISLLAQGEQNAITSTFGNRKHVLAAHGKILSACRDRKPEIASARMAVHVGELEQLVKRRSRASLFEPTRMLVKADA